MPKEVLDHALPYSKKDLPQALTRALVPSCRECNALLSNSLQGTLTQRIEVAKERLAYRYRKVLRTAYWSLEDLLDLSENLRHQVMYNLSLKRFIEDRLAFDYFLWIELDKPDDLLPAIK